MTSKKSYEQRVKHLETLQARYDRKRSTLERIVDRIASFSASISFLLMNAAFFTVWIIFNTGLTGQKPFDPFPFVLLTTIVSLEAIILSIFVLISQNRQSKIADLREEIDLQINMISEQEITKLMRMISVLFKELKIDIEKDPELQEMMQPTDWERIEKVLGSELEQES